jgi:ribosomal protein S18 acetylase RimI-like enzyme
VRLPAGSWTGVTEAPSAWEIQHIRREHKRQDFDCGVASLDEYLRRFARQNDERGIARTRVATEAGELSVLGYHSMRSGAVTFEDLTDDLRRRLPRYPVPVVHLARLAVDRTVQGRGLGEHLLMDALRRSVQVADVVAVHGVEVVAEDERARGFYLAYGFRALVDDRLHLYLSMGAVRRAFGGG